jgi:putative membrane protein
LAALAAVLALAAVWLAPWEQILAAHFPAHMIRHMVMVALAPPMLLLAWPALGRVFGFSPLLGAVAEFALVWGWHVPAAHELARSGAGWFALEQGSFLLVGLLVWAGCLRRDAPLAGAGGLLLTSMHMTLLGALLVLAPRVLYPGAHDGHGHGPDAALAGQQLGGLVMLGLGTPIYLVTGLWLTAQALRDPRHDGERNEPCA